MRGFWWRFQRSSTVAVAVGIVAAMISVATSISSPAVSADRVTGSFLLTIEDPIATIDFEVLGTGPSAENAEVDVYLKARLTTLSPKTVGEVRVTLDGVAVDVEEWSFVSKTCSSNCWPGLHTYRFALEEGSSPVLVRWSMDASVEFAGNDVPEGSSVNLAASLDGPEFLTTTLMESSAGARGWYDTTITVNIESSLSEGSQIWVSFPVRGEEALVLLPDTSVVVLGGGATQIPLAPECFTGPCALTVRLVTSPVKLWSIVAMGDGELPFTLTGETNTKVRRVETAVEYSVALEPNEVREVEVYVRLDDVDPDLVSVIEPIVQVKVAGEGRKLVDERSIRYEIGSKSAPYVGFEADGMTCAGSTCESTIAVKIINLVDEGFDVTTRLEISVLYGQPVPIYTEVRS